MAFADRNKSAVPEICPVCRQKRSITRTIRHPAYGGDGGAMKLCQNCYDRYYADTSAGRRISIEDDSVNPVFRLRPAESLERDSIFRKKRPLIGYEYPLPWLVPRQILHDVLVWVLVCIMMRVFLWIGAGSEYSGQFMQECMTAKLVRYVIYGGSLLGGIIYITYLIQGILHGIGAVRKVALSGAAIVMALISIFCT